MDNQGDQLPNGLQRLAEMGRDPKNKYVPSTPPRPGPQAGDVIFTYSGGWESVGSCLLQRLIFDGLVGPWFSHVAVALSARIAIEAITAPEENETSWTGVTLDRGVRLRLLPDLIYSAKSHVVVRHKSASLIANKFAVQTPHIALMLGSGYSTKPLVAAAKKASAFLAAVVPEGRFDWSAAADPIAQDLRDNAELRAGIEKHLRKGEVLSLTNDYFCSQLVGVLLWRADLLKADPGLVTPCGLFGQLEGDGWLDVTDTDYGAETKGNWERMQEADDWGWQYQEEVAAAKYFRDHELVIPALLLAQEKAQDLVTYLDAVRRKLI